MVDGERFTMDLQAKCVDEGGVGGYRARPGTVNHGRVAGGSPTCIILLIVPCG